MSTTDHIIVTQEKWAQNVRLGKIATVLIVMFGLGLVGLGVAIGQALQYRKNLDEFRELQAQQVELQKALVVAWEQQTAAIQLIQDWVSYIEAREDVVGFNAAMAPVRRPEWKKR